MKAGIVGASGYLGGELLRLLSGHPEIEVAVVQGERSAGESIGALRPGLGAAYAGLTVGGLDVDALAACEVTFLALPSGQSQPIVAALVDSGGLVVDLGADFRLKDPSLYPQWYGFEHQAPQLLARAVYGLVELNRSQLAGARLIAAPGCYVTAASLGLWPLLEQGAIDAKGVIVDAASGVSGAGREAKETTHFGYVHENFSAYGLLDHRHTPEMQQVTGAEILFTPHLAPMMRGILVTAYARASKATSSAELIDLARQYYEGMPFVEVVDHAPTTRETYGANVAKLSYRYDARTGYVITLAALDNLTKGGAGQAIQAANVALGLEETAGLSKVALVP